MRIGFVGTGTMGTPIAGCLIRAGHSLSVYDRRPEATATCARKARRAPTVPSPRRATARWCLPRCPAQRVRGGDAGTADRHPRRAATGRRAYRPDHQCAEDHRSRRRSLPRARGRADRCAGQRPPADDDRDGRRQRRRVRPIPAVVRGDRRQRLPCRAQWRRRDRQAGHAISGLYQFHRLDRRDAGRGQGRDRPRDPGPDRAGQRRAKPHLRQHRARRVSGHLRGRRHARHRRQGCRTRLSARARRRRAGGAGRARLRFLQARPGGGLGPGGFPVVARVLEAMAGVELRPGRQG
jgi:hypothetical protein